jgi:hypothetical protein
MTILVDFLFIVLLLGVAYLGMTTLKQDTAVERFCEEGSTVTFLSSEETRRFLASDPDAYVQNLSPLDLYARKVRTHEQYLRNISQAAASFSAIQKKAYREAAQKADAFLRSLTVNGLDTRALASMPWVFALTKGNVYEDGLPHTRANTIFVTTSMGANADMLLHTLVHEKIHVYQRKHPEIMGQYLQSRGYVQWKQRLGEPRIRANPDLDPYIYVDPSTQQPMAAYYASDKPISITDVVQANPSFEHPYEQMAYELTRLLSDALKP